MKQRVKGYLRFGALLSAIGCICATQAADVRIRSQSVDTARELAGWSNQINLFDMDGIHGSFAVTAEYTQSFNGKQIARSLFGSALNNSGNTGCNKNGSSFRVSGSQASDRAAGDLLADYFGLPLDYQSSVYVKPEIKNFLVDFNFFVGLDQWLPGFWFRIHAPVVYAKWKLRMDESQSATAVIGYPAGYFAPAAVPVSNLNSSFISYLQGAVPTLNGGVVFQPLIYSKLCHTTITGATNGTRSLSCNNATHTIRISDIRFALGWNFWQDANYHIGLGMLAAAPTGSRVDDTLLFQPMVGNGHHWELGGKFTSHSIVWRNSDCDKSITFYFDADATYMFAARQFRVFDLCGAGDTSRYMLAEVMKIPATNNLSGNGISTTGAAPYVAPLAETPTPSVYQFSNIFMPVANIAAQTVKVSQPIQVDLTAMFNYTHRNFSWDFGYNFWVTACEDLNRIGNTTALFQGNATYALKGDAYVYGFDNGNETGGLYDPIALGATESLATICSGTNYPVGTRTPLPGLNTGIDNPEYAYGNATGTVPPYDALFNVTTGGTPATNQTSTSIQAAFLSTPNLDLQGARAKGMSNKLFTHVSYTWHDYGYCYVPYLGLGGKAEFAIGNKNCATTPCANSSGCIVVIDGLNTVAYNSSCDNGCRNSNISEWGIWLKGGVSFN